MVAVHAPIVPLVHPAVQDANTRAYLNALQAGEKPANRPDCGRWSDLVDSVERVFDETKNKGYIVRNMLESLCKLRKYADLKELLSSSPSSLTSILTDDKIDTSTLAYPILPPEVQLPASLATGACQWLDGYIQYSKAVSPEGYEDFHEACGLWILATVAGRRIKIPFSRKQYTPLMIALVARTSLYAKSNTAEAAISVLQSAGLRWLLGSDETTPQKLLTDMCGQLPKNYAEMDEERQFWMRQRLAMSAQRGWYYDEFGSLVKSMSKNGGVMQDFKGLLLKLDNCSDQYEYSTQSRGTELIEKPYLSLLGSMTPSDIRSSAKSGSDFWSDGFWARFAFICPPPDTSIDAPFTLGEVSVPYKLSKSLRDWHDRLGEPVISIEEKQDEKGRVTGHDVVRSDLPETTLDFGEGVYEAWARYRSALKQMLKDWHSEDLDGSYQRLSIKAIRMAALFASLENNNVIEMNHWAKAQDIAERWRRSLHELYAQVNTSELELSYAKRVEDDILKYVRKLEAEKQPPTVRDLSRYLTKVDVGKIKESVADLVRAGLLQEQKSAHGTRYTRVAGEE